MKRFTLFFLMYYTTASFLTHAQEIHLDKYKNQPQTITKIRVASVSVFPEKWEKEINWNRIEHLVRKAKEELNAQVVVTPEGALEGYVINQVNKTEDPQEKETIVEKFKQLGEPLNGPYIQKARALSDELNVFFALGFLERRGDRLFNSVILIDPDGDIIARYSKTHFAQGYTINPSCYTAGDEYPVFDTPFGKAAFLICYDRQLPEPARILALKGAQILFFPSYGSYTDRDGWNTVLLRTRAYENRMPLVFSHPNQSLLIDRKGKLVKIGEAGETVCYEIDTSPEKYKDRFRNRRPGTYTPLTDGPDPAAPGNQR